MPHTSHIPQTELHRHLDASIRLGTLHELGQKKGLIPTSTSLENFSHDFIIRTQQRDLRSVLSKFTLFQKLLDRPETLERVAFESVEDCYREGTRQVEMRYSPHFVAEFSKLDFDLILSSFEAGILRARRAHPEIRVGLLCIVPRDYGMQAAFEAVDFFLENATRFVGIDLAGNEDEHPCRSFEEAFKKVRSHSEGLPITIHSGEGSGPDNVWEAIDLLGASRIGHGIRSIEDPALLLELKRRDICLEICPTSNVVTSTATSYETHPLKKFVDFGIACSINTDDPGIFGVGLLDEFHLAKTQMGLTVAELQFCKSSAYKHSFLRPMP